MASKERVKPIIDKLCRLNYWFCNEMMEDEKKHKEFEKACKEAKNCDHPVVLISTAEGNMLCMKHCMEETVQVINFMRKNYEDIEEWQIVAVEAMFAQCHKERIIPFDLPVAIMATIGMWEELGQCFRSTEE